MRQLRLVYRAEDGSLVVETTDDGEQFTLPVDATLRTAVRTDLPRPGAADDTVAPATEPAPATSAEPAISPREIQVRVRAGESPGDLAETYGMALDRVMRFAGPVVGERRRIADEARRARARRNTSDGVVVVFGEAVDERFAAHGIAPDAVEWDSRRREDGEWIVQAQWQGGGFTEGRHAAEWVFTRASRFVTPIDDTAADLLSDRPVRPIAPPPEPAAASPSAPPLVPGIVAFPVMPDAHTGPVPTVEEVFDQEAPSEGPRTIPPFVAPPAPMHAQAGELDTAPADAPDFDAPPLPLGINDPSERLATLRPLGAGRRIESDEEKAARARVPSWDDILLGVRRKSD